MTSQEMMWLEWWLNRELPQDALVALALGDTPNLRYYFSMLDFREDVQRYDHEVQQCVQHHNVAYLQWPQRPMWGPPVGDSKRAKRLCALVDDLVAKKELVPCHITLFQPPVEQAFNDGVIASELLYPLVRWFGPARFFAALTAHGWHEIPDDVLAFVQKRG